MFVKPGHRQDDPARPLIVRGPNGRLLRPAGEAVPDTTFWYRRLCDGDVVPADPPPAPPAPEQPRPRPPGAVAVAAPVIDPVAARAAADAFVWHVPAQAVVAEPEHEPAAIHDEIQAETKP